MSADDVQSGSGQREVAYRLFAAEFEDADFSYSESDEERAPNYVVTPTGGRVNRLFVVGVLTEVEPVSDDVLRGRIVDPTGAFVVYAGQYQPDAQTFLERADPPTFVAVTGKARTFQPDDSDVVYTSIRPETLNEVDAATRDRWVIQTAEQTLERIGMLAWALQSDLHGDDLRTALAERGVDEGLAAGVPLAIDHYGTTGGYLDALRSTALDAVRVVAGERDEVEPLELRPDQGSADLSALADIEAAATEQATAAEPVSADSDAQDTAVTESASTETAASTPETTETAATATEPDGVEESPTAAAETGPQASGEELPDEQSADEQPAEQEPVDEQAAGTTGGELGEFEPGEFELDDEERQEIKDEFGTDFQSGTEVDDPGEADIETPEPEDISDASAETGASAGATGTESPESASTPVEEAPPAEAASTTEDAPTAEEATTTETAQTDAVESAATESEPAAEAVETDPGADVHLDEAVIEHMRDLDDGDGADREALVAAVVDAYDVTPEDVESAVQDALMDGLCYEPDDDTLKPI